MTPSVQPLNLDWDLSPQQEATLNVEAGVEKYFSNPIRESVKQRREEEAKFDQTIQDIAKGTDQRYQKEVIQKSLDLRNKIKEQSKGNWNGVDARTARLQAITELNELSAKANNYGSKYLQSLEARGKQDPFFILPDARRDALAELSKPISEINQQKLDEILAGDSYTNMEAKLMDSMKKELGNTKNLSDIFTQRFTNGTIVAQYQYGPNWRPRIKSDGSTEKDSYGRPLLEDIFDPETEEGRENLNRIMLTSSGGQLDERGYPTAFKYWEDFLAKKNPDLYNKVKDRESERVEAVYNQVRSVLNGVLTSPSVKEVSTKGDPRDWMSEFNYKSENSKEGIERNNIDKTINYVYSELLAGNINPLNSLLKASKKASINAQSAIFVNSEDEGYLINNRNDRVISLSALKATYPQYVTEDGTSLTEEGMKQYYPFTGLFFKVKNNTGIVNKPFKIGDNDDLFNAVAKIVEFSWNEGGTPLTGENKEPKKNTGSTNATNAVKIGTKGKVR